MLRRVMSLFSIFCRNFFVSVPKNSVGEPFCAVFQKLSGSEKFMDKTGGGGVSRFTVESFLFHRAQNFRRGILYCCINFGYRKSLDKRGRSRFSVENFLSHTAEKLRKGTLDKNTFLSIIFSNFSNIENFLIFGLEKPHD